MKTTAQLIREDIDYFIHLDEDVFTRLDEASWRDRLRALGMTGVVASGLMGNPAQAHAQQWQAPQDQDRISLSQTQAPQDQDRISPSQTQTQTQAQALQIPRVSESWESTYDQVKADHPNAEASEAIIVVRNLDNKHWDIGYGFDTSKHVSKILLKTQSKVEMMQALKTGYSFKDLFGDPTSSDLTGNHISYTWIQPDLNTVSKFFWDGDKISVSRQKLSDVKAQAEKPAQSQTQQAEKPAAKQYEGGWGKTKWGMTMDEVQAVYPDTKKGYSGKSLSMVNTGEVKGVYWETTFRFDNDGGLALTQMTSMQGKQIDVGNLASSLVTKLGKPVDRHEYNDGANADWVWDTGSNGKVVLTLTNIFLHGYHHSPSGNVKATSLEDALYDFNGIVKVTYIRPDFKIDLSNLL